MKNRTLKIIVGLVSVFIIIFTFYQSSTVISKEIKTELAVNTTVEETVTVSGIFVRSEQTISSRTTKVIDYKLEDGQKVSKNEIVALLFERESDANTHYRLNRIIKKIEELTQAENPRNVISTDTAKLENNIAELMCKISALTDENDMSKLGEYKDEMERLINLKQLILGNTNGFNSRITSLQEEKNRLTLQANTNIESIKSPVSGYFVSSADGLESVLTVEKLNTITADEIEKIKSKKIETSKTDGVIGKVIDEFYWYYACVINKKDIYGISVGSDVTLKFMYESNKDIHATVHSIREEEDGRCVLVFRSDYMAGSISPLRVQTADIVMKRYTGLKINAKAQRVIDGVRGVYALVGTQASFKTITPIYQKDDYIVVDLQSDTKNPLALYDQVILGGKDLWDGKVLK